MALVVLLTVQAAACPAGAAAATDSGFAALRRGATADAGRWFAAADSLCPGQAPARVGRGYVALRLGRPETAASLFTSALAADSGDADAWYGLGLARQRLRNLPGAIVAWRRALAVAPHYRDALDALLAAGSDRGLPRPPFTKPATPRVPARTVGERFEIATDRGGGDGWRPFYVKGINLGAALPGKFPTEFPPDDSTYARWLALMAAANANTIRLYTILPPAFYRAFKAWNDGHPDQPLWLVHGVWAEPPPRNDYDDRRWKADFQAEMRRVVDVLHGRGLIGARPGHAFGRYEADVSDRVLAYIIGREWEPQTIRAYNRAHQRRTAFAGRFLAVDSGTAADAWMAEQCDAMLAYEWDTYRAARPIAYTNWPTLDPLHHPTEPTRVEELAIRRRLGLPTRTRLKEYDNDGESLDAMLVRPGPENVAGYFASFHAYPYYPDFIGLDSAYGAAASRDGPSHYFGYLLDLKRHHAGRPLLVAEYGVPSSRGLAHLDPEGFHHGGLDETAMAAVDARLTREIREAGLAGGILFAWLDEWFKHNWVVIDLEQPAERTRMWHNVQDAEQHYGLLGVYAGDSARPEPGGPAAAWLGLRTLQTAGTLTLRAAADPAFLYLALSAADETPLDSLPITIGIDTWRADRGQMLLPDGAGPAGTGVEFAVTLRDTADAQLLVAAGYDPYIGPRPGMRPTDLDAFYDDRATVDARGTDGAYDSLFVTTNRFRVTRDGRQVPARGVNRGRLRYGASAASSLADWYVDREANLIELRLPWGLLNVTDPSTRTILARVRDPGPFAVRVTDGFRFVVAAPAGRLGPTPTWAWPTWEAPLWHERLKPAYFAMRQVWTEW